MKKVVVILPTYNEKGNIEKLVNKIFSQEKNIANWELNVLVVDSKSPDGTAQIVKKLQKEYRRLYLLETERLGLGRAYLDGYKYIFDKINPYVVMQMDADLSHNPDKIKNFLRVIEQGADLVIGSRYIKGGSIPKNWGPHRKIFSIFGNLIIKLGFMKPKISDWTTGYRAIKSWLVKQNEDLLKKYSGYVFQIAFIDQAIKTKAQIKEIPINFKDREKGKSKINFSSYIFDIFIYIFKNSSFIKFFLVGLNGFLIDFSVAYSLINFVKLAKVISNMFSAEIAIICNFFFHNSWSFKHKKIKGGVFTYLKKLLTFNLIASGSILIQGGGMKLFLKLFGDKKIYLAQFPIQSWIIYKVIIVAFFIIPYSYLLYNKVIWKKQ